MKFSLIVPVILLSTGLALAESADDITKELSNPTMALASLNNNLGADRMLKFKVTPVI